VRRLVNAYGFAAGAAIGYCITHGVNLLIDGEVFGVVPLTIGLTGVLLAVAVVLQGGDS
jgi:hypothetical protein